MKKVKLVKIAVLGAAAILGITGCNKQPSEQPLDAKWLALGQFQVGEHDSAWDAALDDNGNVINLMTAVKASELPEAIKTAAGDNEIQYGVKLSDVRLGAKDAGWTAQAMKEDKKVNCNGSFAIKVGEASYDEVDEVWSVTQWIPDPHTAYAISLTPDTLFMPAFQEAADENGFSWASNPVCIGGSGSYTVYGVKFAGGEGKPGYGVGLIKDSEITSEVDGYEEVKEWKAAEHTYGVIGSFAASGWSTDVSLTANADNTAFSATVDFAANDEWKIRADADWTVNWGAGRLDDASKTLLGVASDAANDANIKITEAGSYTITISDFAADASAKITVTKAA